MNKQEIFELNLKINGKQKLSEWLYAETLELAAALMAHRLQPTAEHKRELAEEIADVKLLSDQYKIFNSMEPPDYVPYTPKKIIPLSESIAIHGKKICGGISPSYNFNRLQCCIKKCCSFADIEQVEVIYYEKLHKLKMRLKSGEFNK